MKFAIIGVPTNSSGLTDGVAKAPDALRQAGLVASLNREFDVQDFGNINFQAPVPTRNNAGIIAEDSLVSMLGAVKAAVSTAFAQDRFPLVIGGDCPLLIGCLGALAEKTADLGLIFLDGHEDAYPPDLSPTGEAADMELGLLLKKSPVSAALGAAVPAIEPSRILVFGPRDAAMLNSQQVPSIANDVLFYDEYYLRSAGCKETAVMAMDVFTMAVQSAWLHLDLDILSTEALPAVDYQQPNGLTWEMLDGLSEPILTSGIVRGWNITIYNPNLDHTGISANRIVEFVTQGVRKLAQKTAPTAR